MRILVYVAVASKGGKYIRPCQKQIESGGQTYEKAGQGNKNKKKKKYFGYVYANLCNPPPSGSDAYVLTLYTPTQNIEFF